MADNAWTTAGDYLGVPGLVAGAGYLGSKLPALAARLAPYAARGYGLASGPLGAAMLAHQVLSPTPANAGEAPYYVRDPNTGQMVPNPAATASSKQLLKQVGQGIGQQPTPTPAPTPTPTAPTAGSPNMFGTPSSGALGGAGSLMSPQAMGIMAAIKHAQAGGQLPVSPAGGASPLDNAQWPAGPMGSPSAPSPAASGGPGTMPQYGADGSTSYSPQTNPLSGILSKLFGSSGAANFNSGNPIY